MRTSSYSPRPHHHTPWHKPRWRPPAERRDPSSSAVRGISRGRVRAGGRWYRRLHGRARRERVPGTHRHESAGRVGEGGLLLRVEPRRCRSHYRSGAGREAAERLLCGVWSAHEVCPAATGSQPSSSGSSGSCRPRRGVACAAPRWRWNQRRGGLSGETNEAIRADANRRTEAASSTNAQTNNLKASFLVLNEAQLEVQSLNARAWGQASEDSVPAAERQRRRWRTKERRREAPVFADSPWH